MKIEYVYGQRRSGKTTEILNSLNTDERIAIICSNEYVRAFYFNKIRSMHPDWTAFSFNRIHNISLILNPSDFDGLIFDKAYIDDANTFNYEEILHRLYYTIRPDSTGEIKVYFSWPFLNADFSIRLLGKNY
jgi:hypothetical protein